MRASWLSVPAACLALAAALCAPGCARDRDVPDWLKAKQPQDDFDRATGRPPTPKTLFAMGKLLASQGRDTEAAAMFIEVVRQQPRLIPAYYELADVHMRHNNLSRAAAVLSAGLQVAPHDPVLLNNLGMCRLFQKDYPAALANFTKAAAAAPGDGRYRANIALALGLMGRYEECLAVYGQLLNPAEAHYNLAVICDIRGDEKRADAEYAKAFALDTTLKSRRTPRPARAKAGTK